jgi:hypothetical protein
VVITARMAGNEPAPRITLKFHGTLRDVAERIASEGKLNVVVRGDLDEEAEVYFQSVPADEALETLSKAYGLTVERHGSIFTLRPHLDGSPPRMVAPLPPLPPVPPVPPVAPVPPLPPMPQMHGHPGQHQAAAEDEDQADDDDDEDEGDQAGAADEDDDDSEAAVAQKMGKLKQLLKNHRGNGSDRVSTGDQTVEEDQVVDSVVSYGGSVLVKGRVRRQAVAFGGNVHLGPHAVVDGDVVAFGGTVEREPGAKVHGHIQSFGSKGGGWSAMGPGDRKSVKVTEKRSGWTIPLLFLEFAVCFALGFIFLMFAPKPMRQIEMELRSAPLYCGLTGLVGGAGVLALSLLLTVTIILSPFALILLLVAAVGVAMGFAALASEIGTRLPVLKANRKTQAAVLALGTFVLLMAGLIPVLKFLILGTATCLALGATIRTRFGTRPREFPEAV